MAGPNIAGYEGLTQIGKGGFSRVYRGEQAKLKRGVAIKVLNFGLSDEADRRSFERECELMGRVSTHPNIVTVHDTAFTDDGQPCIVMEHYPGGSLADLIGEVRRLSLKETLEVGVAIAAALEASHQAGVLHCDLKPQNILISEFGQPALGDFGISTFSEERTRTGGDAGAGFTLAYAAPEIVEGASPSAQSDVYSLAATLYTSLAGRRPFYYPGPDGAKPTAADQARRILLEEPASLHDAGVPIEVDQLIRGAMAKEPANRPSSAADFARSLYEVGQQLSLGTSSPRIAAQGGLRVPEPRTDFTERASESESEQSPTATAAVAPVAPAPAPAAPAPVEASLAELPAAAPPLEDATELRADADDTALRERGDDATALRERGDDATALRERGDDATALRERADADATALRERADADATALRADLNEQSPIEPIAAPEQRSRRHRLAPAIGVASLLVVAAVLFAMTRGGGADDTAATTPEPVVATPRAEILLAPPSPANVTLHRVGGAAVVVSWSNPPADDITYEVNIDGSGSRPATTQSPMLFERIGPNDLTCYEVTALRGNRLSPAPQRVCTPPLGSTYVDASPTVCEAPCEVSLELTGFEPDQLVEVTAVDAADGSPVAVEYDQELRTDADGGAPLWRVQFEEEPTGRIYLIELTPVGSDRTHRAFAIVNPPAG